MWDFVFSIFDSLSGASAAIIALTTFVTGILGWVYRQGVRVTKLKNENEALKRQSQARSNRDEVNRNVNNTDSYDARQQLRDQGTGPRNAKR